VGPGRAPELHALPDGAAVLQVNPRPVPGADEVGALSKDKIMIAGDEDLLPRRHAAQPGDETVTEPVGLEVELVVLDGTDVAGDQQGIAARDARQMTVQVTGEDQVHAPTPGS